MFLVHRERRTSQQHGVVPLNQQTKPRTVRRQVESDEHEEYKNLLIISYLLVVSLRRLKVK